MTPNQHLHNAVSVSSPIGQYIPRASTTARTRRLSRLPTRLNFPMSQSDVRFGTSHTVRAGLDELDRVRLTATISLENSILSAGVEGTIVHRYGDGNAFEVEFFAPEHALLTLKANEIEAIGD